MRIEWPLTERELLVAGRARSTYVQRVIAVLVLMVPPFVVWLLVRFIERDLSSQATENLSWMLVNIVSVVQFIAAYFISASGTATSIIDEVEDRTLELLMLANPRGWDIVVSKWVAAVVQSVMIILAVLPVLALAAILGAIDVPAVAYQTYYYILIAMSIVALGVYSSTLMRTGGQAFPFTLLLAAGWVFIGAAIDLLFGLGTQTGISGYVYPIKVFAVLPPWIALPVYSVFTCAISLAAATFRVRSIVLRTTIGTTKAKQIPASSWWLPRRVTVDPVESLIKKSTTPGSRNIEMLLRIILIPICVFLPVWGIFILGVLTSREVSRTLVTMKRDGGWDDLLMTRVDHIDFARDVLRGLRRRVRVFTYAVPVNIFVTLLRFEEMRMWEGVALCACAFAYYHAAIPFAALTATLDGTLRSREARSSTLWIGAICFGIGLPYGVILAIMWYSQNLMGGPVDDALTYGLLAFNFLWPFVAGYIARYLFVRRCDTMPGIGERRRDLLGVKA